MPTIYVSNLDSVATLGTAGIFTGATEPQVALNSTTLTGTCSVAELADAFKFYTTPLTDGTGTTGTTATNFTGVAKTVTTFGNPDLATGRSEMIKLLAGEVFGSPEAGDLFNNNAAIITSFDTAAAACLTAVNDATTTAASVQFVNGLLATNADRFELAYTASVSGAATATQTGVAVKITDGDASGAVVTIECDGPASVLRITSTTDATSSTHFTAGNSVTFVNGGGSGVNVTILSINSVQAAMLNGTLDLATGTESPIEAGDAVRVKYTINGSGSQTDSGGETVTVVYEAYYDFVTPA